MKSLKTNKAGIESDYELAKVAKDHRKKVIEPNKRHRVFIPELKMIVFSNESPEIVKDKYFEKYSIDMPKVQAIEPEKNEIEIIQPEQPEQPLFTGNQRITKSGRKYYKI